MTIETVIKSVCEKCKFYDKSFGVCRGEILPVERAILNNAGGYVIMSRILLLKRRDKYAKNLL